MNFAVISNGIVINLIAADTLEVAEAVSGQTCIEYTDHETVGKGWSYDGTNFVNLNPPTIPEPILNFPLPMD